MLETYRRKEENINLKSAFWRSALHNCIAMYGTKTYRRQHLGFWLWNSTGWGQALYVDAVTDTLVDNSVVYNLFLPILWYKTSRQDFLSSADITNAITNVSVCPMLGVIWNQSYDFPYVPGFRWAFEKAISRLEPRSW